MSVSKDIIDDLKDLSVRKIISINTMLANGLDEVTVCGYGEVPTKYGLMPVFKIAENDLYFWAKTKIFEEKIIPRLKEAYGTAAEIDKALKAKPQIWKIHELITLSNGNKFRPVEILGYAEDDDD